MIPAIFLLTPVESILTAVASVREQSVSSILILVSILNLVSLNKTV